MKLTLLEMVQHILGAMGSDEVSNYDDTVESYQIAQTIKQCFYECAVELGLPEHDTLYQLTASGDNTKPCIMTVPSTATRLDSIHYDNKQTGDPSLYVEVCWMDWQDFFTMQNALRDETTNVGEQAVSNNGQSFNIMYRSNAHPRFYTSTDENVLIFDGYDSSVDTTLQSSKTMAYGATYPTFTLSNSFVADLDATQFPYLLAKAKTRCFMELKQTQNAESAAEARKQKIVVQKRKNLIKGDPAIYDVFRSGRK